MSDLYDHINGEPVVSAKGLSLLLGVPVDQVRALAQFRGTGVDALPAEWVKAGLRRSKEYQAATGRDDMLGALEYWARKEAQS
ncbi:hypothetical protein [Rhodococcus rhodochrous]|uniref:hypothetical protein n=1 Tax=Rhodococcus rhodochrous TaxID=1829 RepID=UPI001D01B490|nr:hypothetical protein [Rhodococcus rhodochrous]